MARRRTTLPIEDYEVREKDFSRLGFVNGKPRRKGRNGATAPVLSGLHLPDQGEIWIDRSLAGAEKDFTLLHELVHARRTLDGQEHDDLEIDELITELEAIARAPRATLQGLYMGRLLLSLKDWLTERGTLDPDQGDDLRRIEAKATSLLEKLRRHRNGSVR